jgi:hypothetical protein
MFGIIGTKKIEAEDKVVVDLSKATIDVKVNGEVVNNVTNILLKKDDKVELVVNNISENVIVIVRICKKNKLNYCINYYHSFNHNIQYIYIFIILI